MSSLEKFDNILPQLIKEGYTKEETESLAEYLLIAEEYKNNNKKAESFWIEYTQKDNGITILKRIKDRFERLT